MIVPAAGLGNRFAQQGYQDPKPFIPVAGAPMVELVVRNMRAILGDVRAVVVLREDMRDRAQQLQIPNVTFAYVPELTRGAAETVLVGLEHVWDYGEVVVANSDQLVDVDREAFDREAFATQGTIVTFPCPTRDPKWSYAEVDSDGFLTRTAEKDPISEHATVGVYRFSQAKLLREAIARMVAADDRTNGEFYLCPSYNHLPKGNVGTRLVECRRMWGMGTPEDLEASIADPTFQEYVRNLSVAR